MSSSTARGALPARSGPCRVTPSRSGVGAPSSRPCRKQSTGRGPSASSAGTESRYGSGPDVTIRGSGFVILPVVLGEPAEHLAHREFPLLGVHQVIRAADLQVALARRRRHRPERL